MTSGHPACASHVFLVHIVYTSPQKFGQHGDGRNSPPLISLTFNILFKCCTVVHLFLLSGSYTMNIHLVIVCLLHTEIMELFS